MRTSFVIWTRLLSSLDLVTGYRAAVRFANPRLLPLLAALLVASPALALEAKPPALSERCLTKSERARAVSFRARDRIALRAVLLGRGKTGIALGHEYHGDLCNWLPFARTLAARGYLVLAFDFRNSGSSQYAPQLLVDRDMVAAAALLRAHGAQRVELAGASMGGTAALAAGASAHAARVASLSGPADFGGVDAVAGVRKLRVPVLLLVGKGDTEFVPDVKRIDAAAHRATTTLSIQDSSAHGTALLAHGNARALLLKFLTAR
jgi:pimeloyl-ACP methyl ester carboxylesterase